MVASCDMLSSMAGYRESTHRDCSNTVQWDARRIKRAPSGSRGVLDVGFAYIVHRLGARELSSELGTFQQLLCRSIIGLPLAADFRNRLCTLR
jgi:hypothetical protein